MKFPLPFRIVCLFLVLIVAGSLTLSAQEKTAPTEFDTLWVPGLAGGALLTFNSPAVFTGGAVRFDLLYGLDSTRPEAFFSDRGRWEIFADVGIYVDLSNLHPIHQQLYIWMLGFNISFETPATLKRNFLIPYIGLELGGLTLSDRGSGFSTMPVLGLNVISLPNCSLSVDGALMLNTLDFEGLLGIKVRANLNFTF